MNSVVLMGRITKDLELKDVGSTTMVKFNLAVNRKKKDEADFINCVAFGKTADIICKYCKKGTQIVVEGRIQTGSYEKEGKKVYTTDVIVNNFYFTETRKDLEPEEEQETELPF